MHNQRLHILREYARKLALRGSHEHLERLMEKSHPADIAYVLKHFEPVEAKLLLNIVRDKQKEAEVIAMLEPHEAVEMLDLLDLDAVSEVLSEMDPDDAARILDEMDDELSLQVLDLLDEEQMEGVDRLLQYPEETAGRIMIPDFLALPLDVTVQEAIEAVREAKEKEMISYLYVIDEHQHLLGVASLRQLIMSPPDTPLADIYEPEVMSVRDTTDQEEVARLVARYDFFAVPVVNDQNQIVGVITVDDIIDIIKDEATEDILMLAGVSDEDLSDTGIIRSAKRRMVWLTVSLAGGLIGASIIQRSSDIPQYSMLVPLFTVITGMGGNVGTQTITLVVRGLGTGAFDRSKFLLLLKRELSVALLMGLVFGVLVGIFAGISQSLIIAPVVGLSLVSAMAVSTAVAVAMPMIFDKVGVDPAISSGPFVTTSIDILGLLIYFSIARAILALAF